MIDIENLPDTLGTSGFAEHKHPELKPIIDVLNEQIKGYGGGLDGTTMYGELAIRTALAYAARQTSDIPGERSEAYKRGFNDGVKSVTNEATHKIVNSLGAERGRGSLEECTQLISISDCADHYVVPIND